MFVLPEKSGWYSRITCVVQFCCTCNFITPHSPMYRDSAHAHCSGLAISMQQQLSRETPDVQPWPRTAVYPEQNGSLIDDVGFKTARPAAPWNRS